MFGFKWAVPLFQVTARTFGEHLHATGIYRIWSGYSAEHFTEQVRVSLAGAQRQHDYLLQLIRMNCLASLNCLLPHAARMRGGRPSLTMHVLSFEFHFRWYDCSRLRWYRSCLGGETFFFPDLLHLCRTTMTARTRSAFQNWWYLSLKYWRMSSKVAGFSCSNVKPERRLWASNVSG